MERRWRRNELERMSKPELQQILRNIGQSTTGYKAQLIKRILGESRPEYTRKTLSERETEPQSRYTKPEIRQESPLTQIPKDVLLETLYKSDYEGIVKLCRTSQQFNKICEDDKFWENYAKRNNIGRDSLFPRGGWKEAVKYYGKISRFSIPMYGRILGNINWIMIEYPDNLEYDPDYGSDFGGHDFIPIPKEEYNKIILKGPVKVAIPHLEKGEDTMEILQNYGKFKKGDEVMMEEPWVDEKQYIIEIKPNTNYGSTLIHVLDSIYRGIWGLPENENRDLEDLIDNVYMPHPYFEGLYVPELRENFWKLASGS
jgi:hypothetical protein